MDTKNQYFNGLGDSRKKTRNFNTKHTLKRYLFHWPLFLVVLGLCIATAFLYLDTVKPNYEIKASILIKDEKKAGDGPQASMLYEMGLSNSSEGVENEIEILKSKKLINQVVTDLQLWVTYKKEGGLIAEDLYKNSPVKLISLKPAGEITNKKITIIIKDSQTFLLKTGNSLTERSFRDTYQSDFGIWKLSANPNIKNFKGVQINILLSDPEQTTAAYQKLVDATLANKLSTSVTLSITDKIPQRGKDILNSMISNYNSFSATDKNQETKSALDFLNQRIDSLQKELTTSEKGIEGFKSSRGLTDISSESQIQLENMQENDKNLNEVNIKLNVIDGIESYVNSNQNSEKAPATLGITDPALSNSIEKLSLLQLQHDKLAATMPETNPDFDPVNNQIKTTKAAIRENVKNIKASLIGTKQKLESFNSKFESSIKKMPSEERQYVSIKRQQTSKESLYTFLLQQREQISVKHASNLANNRIVDQAYANIPQNLTLVVYFIALFFGIGIPAGIIYVRHSLSGKITTVNEITDDVEIPVVSELPFERTKNSIAIKNDTINAISEQLRALRIKLHFLHNDRETGRVTLLTSSIPGEGKSFISTNLALALTLAERKTIVLELDMRKPKIAVSLGVDGHTSGMSEYLNGKATKEEIIQSFETIPNLHIITAGSTVNNPSELLEKVKLKELILALREEYDDIIIDSPPVHLVPDAAILSNLADITLYVIRQGVTSKAELGFINQLCEQKQLKNIYLIFNGIERIKYGYGYHYDNAYYTRKRRGVLIPGFGDFANRF